MPNTITLPAAEIRKHVRSVKRIPVEVLPDRAARDELVRLAKLGQVEAYQAGPDPHYFNLWFEHPRRERIPVAEWYSLWRLANPGR